MALAESRAAAGAAPGRARSRVARGSALRRVHVAIALSYWTVVTADRREGAAQIAAALVLVGCWWLLLEVAVLRDRAGVHARSSDAIALVAATLGELVVALALASVVALPVDRAELVLGVVEVGALAVVWHVVVAGACSIGRGLRCVLIGRPAAARLLLREPLAPGAPPFELVGLIDDTPSPGGPPTGSAVAGVPVLGALDDLAQALSGGGIDAVVVGSRTGRPEVFARLVELAHLDLKVIELPQFFEREFGRVPVDAITSVWFLHALQRDRRGPEALVKRCLDIACASALAVLAAPLVTVAAILIRRTSDGPVLYRQTRVGEHGRPFTVYKLRSMRSDAEASGAVWAQSDDPRMTAVGRYLRRYRIDELPQLWNVLRGEMTMVGPRPERPEFVEGLIDAVPFYEPRHLTKPGLTGWAQVSAGYAASLDDARLKLSYDLYYLKHRGLLLDLSILLRTVGVVLRGRGAR